MLSTSSALFWLVFFSAGFALAGMAYARRVRGDLEDFIVARNSQGSVATVLTLLASSLGAWILLSPPQAATWGGLAAVIGYALGAMSPRLAMIPLGQRMRELMPRGHSLTEFLMARYGRPMYALALLIMLFYMFIAMAAEITAIAMLVTLLAPVPLWLTAAIVLGFTLLYTAYGGLRASIFTDKVQIVIIVPLLLALVAIGWHAAGGARPVIEGLQQKAPQLLDLTDPVGIKAGLTFFVAILLTGIFHQGNWQRIYSARSIGDMRRGFLLGGVLVVPFIFVMGLFGLAYVALAPGGDSSVALFSVVMPSLPVWMAVALIPLGLALVMSSADTTISAVSCIIAVDVGRLLPRARPATLMRLARWLILLLAVPVMVVAAQGYSVLYLFLLADLLCAAAAFPVFFGLYSRGHDGFDATVATLAGLAAGLLVFPRPGQPMDHLLEAFLLAALVPALVVGLLRLLRPRRTPFELQSLAASVRRLDQPQAD
ncbi:sodium:solute symporter [Corticibacter populi]|uniref:Sodium:solute symporter n=1 Tax=Corticibacter populi TaxID=1550736 RepID=A0A3M6QN50_9BURK|nr:sodium:solute symporter family protein [Corticibacter populi]RMX04161.1 sodium:solute symporter [Corticibacter populi]RZS33180.1 Na+/proline symporter [Corticibacter populi]